MLAITVVSFCGLESNVKLIFVYISLIFLTENTEKGNVGQKCYVVFIDFLKKN